jgi:rhamnose utilization protein RhaD (predicted bifunctional aldolase and dehydrogenase)/NAD(P)-dependent dehydrogenase (short-subunit alcohol dehydrogenase family)
MLSQWNDKEAGKFASDPLQLRTYTSRLLGKEPSLVLHGGGNTSVKLETEDFYGDPVKALYVKGSGWDLATIEPQGFSPVRLDKLIKLGSLDSIKDSELVREQRLALLDPNAPNPSIEAVLHALIPFKYVDHTHADAVVAITNTENGDEKIKEIFGDQVLLIPYVMPGFILAKKIYELTRDHDWSKLKGMILLHHGVFTFSDDAKVSYENMIDIVTKAEEYIQKNGNKEILSTLEDSNETDSKDIDPLFIAKARKAASAASKKALIAKTLRSSSLNAALKLKNLDEAFSRGPLTPDHIISTKQIPVIFGDDPEKSIEEFSSNYNSYFDRNNDGSLQILSPEPCWGISKDGFAIAFGKNIKRSKVVYDIANHTLKGITWAESLGGWKALPEKDLFEMEYWELEQAKLKKGSATSPFEGKVALVTGAASGIGLASIKKLVSDGACVIALDINPEFNSTFLKENGISENQCLPLVVDITDTHKVREAIKEGILEFGGIDILVSNAGSFPNAKAISDIDDATWDKNIELNLNSHFRLIRECTPYLKLGVDPAVVIVGSKNVPAPGPGVSPYSASKAGLTQLARVAALELGEFGIRVNTVHPNAVFDTGVWNDDVIAARAESYKISVEEYKKKNVLKTTITSHDVADLISTMAGKNFSKTTGAQIPIDGGNDRVI